MRKYHQHTLEEVAESHGFRIVPISHGGECSGCDGKRRVIDSATGYVQYEGTVVGTWAWLHKQGKGEYNEPEPLWIHGSTRPPWVWKALDLSTAHIPEASLREQDPLDGHKGLRWCPHKYGYIIFLGGAEEDADVPSWFVPILDLAKEVGASLVNFDADGSICEHLRILSK